MTNADKFKEVFDIYATELWAMPEADFLKWLNTDRKDEPTISKMEQVEDEPKTESIVGNSDTENAKYTSDCPWR